MAERSLRDKLYILFLFIYDQLYHMLKAILFKVTGYHEVQRICQGKFDIYTKTFQIEDWLIKTNSRPIREVIEKYTNPDGDHLIGEQLLSYIANSRLTDNGDQESDDQQQHDEGSSHGTKGLKRVDSISKISFLCSLNSTLEGAVDETYNVIARHKNLARCPFRYRLDLKDALHRIYTYKRVELVINQLAYTKYDANIPLHAMKLTSLWNHMIPDEPIDGSNLISNRWSRIGFQGDDPGTDFRGMGLLSLFNLEYLAKHRNVVAKDLLANNITKYPFAIVGINLTFALFNMIKNGHLKHFFYDDKNFKRYERCNTITTINELYAELFLRFNGYWSQRAPQTIMEFNSILDDFVLIIQEDLRQRNFSIKFIYEG